MLSLDYSAILRTLPDRAPVWHALQDWANAHPRVEAVPVVELMTDLQNKIGATDLLAAIEELVSHGRAQKVYRVFDPAMKVLLKPSYRSWKEIPDKVQNNWDQWIEVTPLDVAMVLEAAK